MASRFCCYFVASLVSVLVEGLVEPYNVVVAVALPVTLTVVVTDTFVQPGSPVCCAALVVCRKVLVYADWIQGYMYTLGRRGLRVSNSPVSS